MLPHLAVYRDRGAEAEIADEYESLDQATLGPGHRFSRFWPSAFLARQRVRGRPRFAFFAFLAGWPAGRTVLCVFAFFETR